MHDNPLGPIMHLKELERQASPKLRPLRSKREDALLLAAVAAVRRSCGALTKVLLYTPKAELLLPMRRAVGAHKLRTE
jgi:hypothetical protein